MKRSGAEVALAHLERVRQTSQWGSSRRYQALSQGGRALPCFVKVDLHGRQGVLLPAMLALALGETRVLQCLPVSVYGLRYMARTAFGHLIECSLVNCA